MSSQSEKEAKEQLQHKADLFRSVFQVPNGARVIKMLEDEFCPSAEVLLEMTDNQLRAKIAQRDVLEYITRLLEWDRVDL
jgi:hypothetical protein